MKGDAGAALVAVIIIVIGIAALFVYFQNPGAIAFPQLSIRQAVYSNDIVGVSSLYVSDAAPYEGQKTTIEFTVSNNGPYDVEDVEVVLDPPTGFTSDVRCDGQAACKFDLDRGEAVDVLMTLTAIGGGSCGSAAPDNLVTGAATTGSDFIGPPAPEQEPEDPLQFAGTIEGVVQSQAGSSAPSGAVSGDCSLKQIINTDVRYSVKYHYSGNREFHIPILKSRVLPQGQSFFAGEPTYGPVRLDYTPPAARQLRDGTAAVFATDGVPFEMRFTVSHIGSAGVIKPIVMKGSGQDAQNTLVFTRLDNLAIQSDNCGGSIDADSKTIKPPFSDDPVIGQLSGFRVPFEFTCSFLPTGKEDFTEGIIEAEYRYDYELLFSQSFSILPIGTQKIEPPGALGINPADIAELPDGTAPGQPSSVQPSSGTPNTPSPTQLAIATGKPSYTASETVTVSGVTPLGAAGTAVSIQVVDPTNGIKQILQLTPSASGTFSGSLSPIGGLTPGTWTVKAKTTTGDQSAETSFTVA